MGPDRYVHRAYTPTLTASEALNTPGVDYSVFSPSYLKNISNRDTR